MICFLQYTYWQVQAVYLQLRTDVCFKIYVALRVPVWQYCSPHVAASMWPPTHTEPHSHANHWVLPASTWLPMEFVHIFLPARLVPSVDWLWSRGYHHSNGIVVKRNCWQFTGTLRDIFFSTLVGIMTSQKYVVILNKSNKLEKYWFNQKGWWE